MVMVTTFTKFRQNAKTYFDAVEKRGTVVRVMRHGKVIAEIVPAASPRSTWKDKTPAITIPGVSLSKAIVEDRENSRS